jgi:hypothetical protein
MRLHELLAGHSLLEIDLGQTEQDDNPGLGSSTPLATMAAPGAAATGGVTGFAGAVPVGQEFKLNRLKPLRRLKRLNHID